MLVLWHEKVLLSTLQPVVNRKLGNRIANIVSQSCYHPHTPLNAVSHIFHIDIGQGLDNLILRFVERIVEFKITKELIIGLAGIANLQHRKSDKKG